MTSSGKEDNFFRICDPWKESKIFLSLYFLYYYKCCNTTILPYVSLLKHYFRRMLQYYYVNLCATIVALFQKYQKHINTVSVVS